MYMYVQFVFNFRMFHMTDLYTKFLDWYTYVYLKNYNQLLKIFSQGF